MLQQWSQRWCNNELPPCLVELLMHLVVIPLKKPDGKPRPVALGELLLKLPMAVAFDVSKDACQKFMESRIQIATTSAHPSCLHKQFGVGASAGADLMVQHSAVLLKQAPHRANIQLDVSNAFGEVDRAFTLDAIREGPALLVGKITTSKEITTGWEETA